MITALYAVVGALLGLTAVLALIWFRPVRREPTETERMLAEAWKERNRLHESEVLALQKIAVAVETWQRRYTRRKKGVDAEGSK